MSFELPIPYESVIIFTILGMCLGYLIFIATRSNSRWPTLELLKLNPRHSYTVFELVQKIARQRRFARIFLDIYYFAITFTLFVIPAWLALEDKNSVYTTGYFTAILFLGSLNCLLFTAFLLFLEAEKKWMAVINNKLAISPAGKYPKSYIWLEPLATAVIMCIAYLAAKAGVNIALIVIITIIIRLLYDLFVLNNTRIKYRKYLSLVERWHKQVGEAKLTESDFSL